MKSPLQGIPRIWSALQPENKDIYRLFRRDFVWHPAMGKTTVAISADSTYCLFVNGQRCKIAQLSDIPGHSTYTSLDITDMLKDGDNAIAVEVHFMGLSFLTYTAGQAFLCLALTLADGTTLLQSDDSWQCLAAPWYAASLQCKVDMQLAYVFYKDARQALPGWQLPGYDASAWQRAVCLPGMEATQGMSERRVPLLAEGAAMSAQVVQSGVLRRFGEKKTFALTAFTDYLSPRHYNHCFVPDSSKHGAVDNPSSIIGKRHTFRLVPGGEAIEFLPKGADDDGYYAIMDLGRESCGLMYIAVEAPSGTVVDVCHGEHLDDGRVRTEVGTRNFADRLICTDGVTTLLYPHRRLGCRYIELHFTGCGDGAVRIHYAGLIPLELPLPPQSAFTCDDQLMLHINRLSVDTLKLCMHEHYEDCPWREQSLYAYDSRNQMLYGCYLWGNYDFAAASLRLLAHSWDGNRQLALTAPGQVVGPSFFTIPVFTLVWVAEVFEYTMFTGSLELYNELSHIAKAILDGALADPDTSCPGLYNPGPDDYVWNFCEWSGVLSRQHGSRQSPYNLYLHESLRCGARLAAMAGDQESATRWSKAAEALGDAIRTYFWDEAEARVCVRQSGDPETEQEGYEHLQAVALANDLVVPEHQAALLAHFEAKDLHPIGLNTLYYLVEACQERGPQWRSYLYRQLREMLDAIALTGATSLWETRSGGDDFDLGGSLCHGWSSVMPYYCRRVLLGVQPIEPGFKRFLVKPYSAGLPRAAGEIPTPAGTIKVEWFKQADGLHLTVSHPAVLTALLEQYPEEPVATFKDIAE